MSFFFLGERRERDSVFTRANLFTQSFYTRFPRVCVRAHVFLSRIRINYNLIATNIVPDERKFAHVSRDSFRAMETVEMLVLGPTLCATSPCATRDKEASTRAGKKRIKNRRCASRVDKSADARVSTIRSINISLDMISRGPLFHLASFTRLVPTSTAVSFPS